MLGEGSWTILYYSTDLAGNSETPKTTKIRADTSKPSTSSSAPSGWQKQNVNVTLSPFDAISGIYATLSCQFLSPASTCTPSGNSTLVQVSVEGVSTVFFYSIDVAGNNESIKSATVYIDKTAPNTTVYVTGTQEPDPYDDWFMDFANVTLAPSDPLPASGQASGIASALYCIDQANTCTPSISGFNFFVTTKGVNYVRYRSTDNAGNAEAVKSIMVKVDKDTDGDGTYDNFENVGCSSSNGNPAYQGCPVGENNQIVMSIIDQAKSGVCGCNKKANFQTKEFRYGSGCIAAKLTNYQGKDPRDYFTCNDSEGYTIITIHSATLANSGIQKNTMKVNGKEITNFAYKGTDSAGLFVWQTRVPQLDSQDKIKIHLDANRILTSSCKIDPTCDVNVNGAEVRVFDRNNAAFASQWGQDPKETNYPAIYESSTGFVGSCTTDETGTCITGENSTGKYLAIAKYKDNTINQTVYVGRLKEPGDFKDTNGDKINDFATKDFSITKVISKDGTVSFKASGKMIILGSILEIIRPDYMIWENTRELYPFIFKSDSDWSVDVCLYVPEGYRISSVIDTDGNEILGINCTQEFIKNETKVILFTVMETGSPEPNVNAELKLTNPHGVASVVALEIPGQRVRAPFDAMLAALIVGTAVIVAILIGLVTMREKKNNKK
jgi:hypothetical protein